MQNHLVTAVTDYFKANHPEAYGLLEDPDRAMQEDAEAFASFMRGGEVSEAEPLPLRLGKFYAFL